MAALEVIDLTSDEEVIIIPSDKPFPLEKSMHNVRNEHHASPKRLSLAERLGEEVSKTIQSSRKTRRGNNSPPRSTTSKAANGVSKPPTKAILNNHRKRSPSRERDRDNSLFLMDTTGVNVSGGGVSFQKPTPVGSYNVIVPNHRLAKDGLLLPLHVRVEGESSGLVNELIAETEAALADNDVSLDFVNYESDKIVRRYWEEEDVNDGIGEKARTVLCNKCGEAGHIARECRMRVCEKCGVRDEHSTLGCPMSKKCFTCGMSGHINKDCQYRGRLQALVCERCGSRLHVTLECPSLWRIYSYMSNEGHRDTVARRSKAADLHVGEGGECYIATDTWCYNCGDEGHFGDECDNQTSMHDRPKEPSAFGRYNLETGPFSSIDVDDGRRGRQRAWENLDQFTFGVDLDVGKKAKRKRIAAQAEQERRHRGDEDDGWFADRTSGKQSRKQERKVQREEKRQKHKEVRREAKEAREARKLRANSSSGAYLPSASTSSRGRYHDRTPPTAYSSGSTNPSREHSRGHYRERDHRYEQTRRDYGPRYHGGYNP